MQSSSVSSDFTKKLLNFEKVSLANNEIASLMDTTVCNKETREEPVFEAANTKMQYDQGNKIGHPDDQPDNEEAPKHDWFQKPDKPQTPDRAGNKSKSVDFRSPQKWISTIAKARKPPRTFDELMGTPIDFSAYIHRTQHVLITGTSQSRQHGIVDSYLASNLKEEVNVAVQLQLNKLREEAQAENQ
nr:hypothetical protein [Tanacetum cinerariifolium]